jgi:hypothetical protein
MINWAGYNSSGITVTDGPDQTLRGSAVNGLLGTTSASVRVTSKRNINGSPANDTMTESFSPNTVVSMGAVGIRAP